MNIAWSRDMDEVVGTDKFWNTNRTPKCHPMTPPIASPGGSRSSPRAV
jgi:hypothetical protein